MWYVSNIIKLRFCGILIKINKKLIFIQNFIKVFKKIFLNNYQKLNKFFL